MSPQEYWAGYDLMKQGRAVSTSAESVPTIGELMNRYGGYVEASRKKKGANKGYKITYQWEWRNYAAYEKELEKYYPKEYALTQLRELKNFLLCDMWWNTPDYRAIHLREYRSEVTTIRKKYGLTSAEVSEFMRVG